MPRCGSDWLSNSSTRPALASCSAWARSNRANNGRACCCTESPKPANCARKRNAVRLVAADDASSDETTPLPEHFVRLALNKPSTTFNSAVPRFFKLPASWKAATR